MGMKKRWKAAILSLDGKIASRFLSAAREEGSLLCFLFRAIMCGKEIRLTVAGYKRLKTEEVESDLKKKFGKDALRPVGDLDRPFTPGELREFAGHRLVSVGNHTKNHAILTNYGLAEVREQIQGGQDALQQMTEKTPEMISYPNGNSSPQIEQAAREAGLQLGVLVRRGKNRLPLKIGRPEAMSLKRFIRWGDCGIVVQCL